MSQAQAEPKACCGILGKGGHCSGLGLLPLPLTQPPQAWLGSPVLQLKAQGTGSQDTWVGFLAWASHSLSLGLGSLFWNPKGFQSLPLNSLLVLIFPENKGGMLVWENWPYRFGQ